MTTDYITETELLAYAKSNAGTGNTVLTSAITAASRAIDAHCGRFFYAPAATSVRYFSADPRRDDCLWILPLGSHDLANTTSLVVASETGNDGTYPDIWTIGTDFIVEPVNQSENGIEGWPYRRLRAIGGKVWPLRVISWYRETVKITGNFGWTAVPEPVKQATKVLASQLVKLGDAPLGVAGWGAYGDIKVREIPQVATLLAPYRHTASAVGVA